MTVTNVMQMQLFKLAGICFVGLLTVTGANAALFEDDEARRAILDLRQRVEALRSDSDQVKKLSEEENSGRGKSLLDLQRQIEMLRTEIASLRGANEEFSRELADVQRQQKDQAAALNDRMSKFEPIKVTVDGVDFLVEPAEKRDFEAALAVFRKGDFAGSQAFFVAFIGRYPSSQYVSSALFWLGNAQYATRDYKEAIINFRALIAKNSENMRAPEAVLSIANCQLELKDAKGARKTLADLIKAYPQSEAAVAAKERLAAMK